MARLYADENFPLPAVDELRRLGHDVETCQEAGQAGQGLADDVVVEYATREGRAVLTLNRLHFVRLHRARPGHAGMVVCSFDPDFSALAGRVHEAVLAVPHLRGELLRVNRPGT